MSSPRDVRASAGWLALKLLGRHVPVQAEIDELGAFSVHPDQGELIDWLGTAASPLEAVHLVHGEPDAASALGSLIAQRDQHAVVARAGERIRDAFSG